ncbi:hypothetical protein [Methylomonas sp. MgM2]
MFYQLKDKLNRLKFSFACRKIYDTPPVLAKTDEAVAVLTLLQHKDVLLFLIAIKSFTKQVHINKVIVINDGSLTQNDIKILQNHIPIIEIQDAKEFAEEACPKGGCWERLLAIARYVQDYYVIQLDSDTLTLSEIDEVNQHIATETAFVIGTWDNQTIEPMKVCSERVRRNVTLTPESHVQMVAEANFIKIDNIDSLNYVRGCAGFTGFPKNSFTKAFILEVSQQIEKAIGNKWREWGSEQVMSNIVVANINRSAVLPHPKYCDCKKIKTGITHFIHFIGECRFKSDIYQKLTTELMLKL